MKEQQSQLGGWRGCAVISALLCLSLAACGKRSGESRGAAGRVELKVWAHHGKPAEWKTIQAQVERFNGSQEKVHVELVEIAEGSYDTQVQSAAASGALPDVMEFDGPMLANYAWKRYLAPLNGREFDQLRPDLLPSIVQQGTYAGKFYGIGTFDSGLGLYADRRQLAAVGGRIPEGYQDAWKVAEFNQLLEKLAAREKQKGGDGQVLDLKRDYQGEWWCYGFYPVLVSAGADLIDRKDYQSAAGVLNSREAAEALNQLQGWFKSGYVDPNTDGRAFVDGRVAISWVGHWEYPRYHEALGTNLVLVPLPDFGDGTRTAMGSWAWGMTRRCENSGAAWQFLNFLMRPEEILAITDVNGAVPARESVVAKSPLYQQDGPLHLYVEQLQHVAVPRPETPAYPVISSAFQDAMLNIMEGARVSSQLDKAVQVIDEDIRENEGYPPPEGSL